jgi:hypothetical protein
MYSPDRRVEMIERLRALSPPSKYLIYVAGVLVVLLVAVGVGATAAVVVGWQSGRVTTGPAETSTLEGTTLESPSDSQYSDDTSHKASFVHQGSLANTAGNYTYLDDQLTNGEPDAVLSVTQNWNPGGGRGVYNDHPLDTVYDTQVKRWAIYNRDDVSIPKGAAFNIAVSAWAT